MRTLPAVQRLPFSVRRRPVRRGSARRRLVANDTPFPVHVLRFAFLGGLLALVIANVSTSDDAFSCRLCETGLSADADSPDFLAPQALDAAVFAQLAEGDAERTSSRTPALDPAAAGAGSGGETLPGPDEPMPTTRPCPGYRTIEEMMAAASS